MVNIPVVSFKANMFPLFPPKKNRWNCNFYSKTKSNTSNCQLHCQICAVGNSYAIGKFAVIILLAKGTLGAMLNEFAKQKISEESLSLACVAGGIVSAHEIKFSRQSRQASGEAARRMGRGTLRAAKPR